MNCEILSLDMAIDVVDMPQKKLIPYLGKHAPNQGCFHLMPIPPGNLQYYTKVTTLIEQDIDCLKKTCRDYQRNWIVEKNTEENALRLVPNTKLGRQIKTNLKLILLLRSCCGLSIKGAFKNTKTGEIMLMSSINKNICEYKFRLIDSHDSDWKICQCKMIAPLIFWDELKNILLNERKAMSENGEKSDDDEEEEDDCEEEVGETVLPTIKKNRQNFRAKYEMVSPTIRREIIVKIDAGEVDTKVKTGQKAKWWLKNHYPKKEIPTNIYLLGGGVTLRELHERYNKEYTDKNITWVDFRNYTRELVAQGILYKQ
jgi:hypothetical protein